MPDPAPAPSRRLLARPFVQATLALAVFLLGAAVLFATSPEPERNLEELPPLVVSTVPLERRDMTPMASYAGRLQPARSAALRFEVTGRLEARSAEPGQAVSTGDVLLALADGDFRDRLRTAEAELRLERSRIERDRERLRQATLRRDLQKREVASSRDLGKRDLLSESAINTVEARLAEIESRVVELRHDVDTADLRIAQKEAAADQARRDLSRARLTAPFDGHVNTVVPEIGDRITGAEVMLELVDVSALDFYVEVDGSTASALQLGDSLAVETSAGPVAGSVIALQPNPDTRTFTHALRVRIPGDGLLPGQTARIRVPLPTLRQAWVVPTEAVLASTGGKTIFRITGDRLQPVPVRLGPRVGNLQVIEGALAEGWQIVSRSVAALDPGRQVQARPEPAS